ncbi:diacylglycerol kinase family protein [Novosphingobium sp. KA1]|uniref:diacylglycerol kinase family protein n=1 Tax=Novosphingobium sp. (strain KA1) TaxID=164608 RepID=UPI001A8C9129|nr:diacylglycerol kinase family protein [Novosphingobium sp. KA1]
MARPNVLQERGAEVIRQVVAALQVRRERAFGPAPKEAAGRSIAGHGCGRAQPDARFRGLAGVANGHNAGCMGEPARQRYGKGEAVRYHTAGLRMAVISNAKAHRNRLVASEGAYEGSGKAGFSRLHVAPKSVQELEWAVASIAREYPDLLVIDGGDGTIRDVLTLAARYFRGGLPNIVVVPSGKTNALAHDLGVPAGWTLEQALTQLEWQIARRYPLEICYGDKDRPDQCGFLFGTGAFAEATALAQSVHRAGVFGTPAVALSLAASIGGALWRQRRGKQREGEVVGIALGKDDCLADWHSFMLLAGSLERLPLGLKVFGPRRTGMNLLTVDAPARQLLASSAAIIAGARCSWLIRNGYVRSNPARFRLRLSSEFVLDGERYPGGDLEVREGRGINFLVPV